MATVVVIVSLIICVHLFIVRVQSFWGASLNGVDFKEKGSVFGKRANVHWRPVPRELRPLSPRRKTLPSEWAITGDVRILEQSNLESTGANGGVSRQCGIGGVNHHPALALASRRRSFGKKLFTLPTSSRSLNMRASRAGGVRVYFESRTDIDVISARN